MFLLGFLLNINVINCKNRFSGYGIKIFIMGFVLTEFLLFAQGGNLFFNWKHIPMYHENLFLSSIWLVVGIIMIISTIVVVAYVGFSIVSSGITNEISSGNQYDELAELKSSYNDLESQFDGVKSLYYDNGDTAQVQKYNDAR